MDHTPGELVFLALLGGALLSAIWNAVVKSGTEKYLDIVLISTASGAIGLVLLPFLEQPVVASWPYLTASALLQQIYFVLLAAVYKTGDMSEAYPLMRGTAPLLVAMAGGPLIGEVLPIERWIAVALICGGALVLAFDAHRRRGAHGSMAPLALVNAVVIAGYTLLDGVGVRTSQAPVAYAMWMFVLTAIPPLVWALLLRRREFFEQARKRLVLGAMGGASTLASYGIALWAMTHVPIALVAALRETSILFATAIAALVLRERIGLTRYIAIGLIALGALTIRLEP